MPPRKRKGEDTYAHGIATTMGTQMKSHTTLLNRHVAKKLSSLTLKPDHSTRPLWVLPTGSILLDTSSPIYATAYDFLVTISEPQSRPTYIHEYLLTPYSLYAASAVNFTEKGIITTLERFSKTVVPDNVKDFIKKCTSRYGKVKLVLRNGRLYVEALNTKEGVGILRGLGGNKEIMACRVIVRNDLKEGEKEGEDDREKEKNELEEEGFIEGYVDEEIKGNLNAIKGIGDEEEEEEESDSDDSSDEEGGGHTARLLKNLDQTRNKTSSVSFEIQPSMVSTVKKTAANLNYPLMEEYDFRTDDTILSIPNYHLRPTTRIRRYQEKSLSKMFGNGRARSGIIVLPCGAGKTLTGVTASQTIGKSAVVLCTNAVSVEQWKQQFEKWTTINSGSNKDTGRIARFTSDHQDKMHPDGCVLVTTYTMMTFSGKRTPQSQAFMEKLVQRDWGLLMMDEVHVVPANTFRRVIANVKAHTRLGLTATLVREDDLIADLNFLIGPKLYEANWMDLTKAGFLANVQCLEVWCPMTPEFMREYLRSDRMRQQQLLYIMNPKKMQVVKFLLNKHQSRGDQIIVFSDDVRALVYYGRRFDGQIIHGGTPEFERQAVLRLFREGSINTLFISKVGDTSIDLPEANVIIQIASHFGSRRQEAQRLGRILRPKESTAQDGTNTDSFNAFFYTCVSKDTSEMYYCTKRQQYLIDQGYTFKVLTSLHERAAEWCKKGKPFLSTKKEQVEVLRDVLEETALAGDAQKAESEEMKFLRQEGKKGENRNLEVDFFEKRSGGLSSVSGGGAKSYEERSAGKGNKLIKSRNKNKKQNIFDL
ncbi:hypothetical protein TrLO_g6257 [Triparma laevis f. longispina]|uniref:DNA 3'-5' helicase n=1 Tax=Triparma laevis f. longispina TaxID=1714387 RepID=A0A9W7B118_9STRA|nr:hypothetical protein TrLO_g6257 [Triparma laevis f. longispina]